MKYPKWSPTEVIKLIAESKSRLNSQREWGAGEKELLQRDVEMWQRLATSPEMEVIWKKIIDNGKDHGWLTGTRGSILAVEILVRVVNDVRNKYDTGVKLTKKDYESELKDIAQLASSLSNKLRKFSVADEENNPFLYRLLLANENLNLLSKVLKPQTFDQELRDLWWCHRPEHYLDPVLPPINKLLELLSHAARVELQEKELRLDLPTKVGAANAFRTYFISSIGSFLTSSWTQYSPSNIATFCSVALDDDAITADLVSKLLPEGNDLIPKPLTQAELLDMWKQSEKILKMVREHLYPSNPMED